MDLLKEFRHDWRGNNCQTCKEPSNIINSTAVCELKMITELASLRSKLAEQEQETIHRLREKYIETGHVAGCTAFVHLQALMAEQ